MLQEYPPLQHLYQGTVIGNDGSQGVMIMHEDMRQPLSQCMQLYADGTFKMTAPIRGFQQVYALHFRKLDSGFPAIVVFASAQTTCMYNAIWEKVLEMIPSLRENVTTLTGDFEMAQIDSFRTNFPQARICGCLFHYKQFDERQRLVADDDGDERDGPDEGALNINLNATPGATTVVT
nr:PREDICTED: uncharacterized protein LOC105272546 [Fopius arisanus]